MVKLGHDDEELTARLKKLLSFWKVGATSVVVLGSEEREEGPHDEVSLQSTGASDTSRSRLDRAALVE